MRTTIEERTMSELQVVIPTRGRVGRQRTLGNLPPDIRAQTILVCPEQEDERHQADWPDVRIMVQPDPDMTIAAKRAWIIENLEATRCLMLDDDLTFYVRKTPEEQTADFPQLKYAEDSHTRHWFNELNAQLDEHAHAGFGPRQMNQSQPWGWLTPGRMMLALGWHLPTLRHVCELGRIEHREDFDYTLQLLRAGYPNAVCHTFVVGQASYDEIGGCSDQRTVEASDRDARLLERYHPGYVKAVARSYKNAPDRLEVTCAWRRALESGAQSLLESGEDDPEDRWTLTEGGTLRMESGDSSVPTREGDS